MKKEKSNLDLKRKEPSCDRQTDRQTDQRTLFNKNEDDNAHLSFE
jgi:hypothetical protein